MENEVKVIKDTGYRLCWYMRGGLSIQEYLYNTDLEDIDIMQKISKEHIENTQRSKMPLL